jgi:hypothetical protein
MAAERSPGGGERGVGTRVYMEEAFRHNTIQGYVCYILKGTVSRICHQRC